jgi:hypothetical protein
VHDTIVGGGTRRWLAAISFLANDRPWLMSHVLPEIEILLWVDLLPDTATLEIYIRNFSIAISVEFGKQRL